MLDHQQIAARIPHSGAMCLLHSVQAWDDTSITCTATNHRDNTHPLRVNEQLPMLCGIEYGAQAMAVHGSLRENNSQKEGYLVSVRDVTCHAARLDTIAGELTVRAEVQQAADNISHYRFSLHSASQCLLEGLAMVMIKQKGELP